MNKPKTRTKTKKELLGLLQESKGGKTTLCYTCEHALAASLTRELIALLVEQQEEGNMLEYTQRSLHRAVEKECKERGEPYKRKVQHFQRHLVHAGLAGLWSRE